MAHLGSRLRDIHGPLDPAGRHRGDRSQHAVADEPNASTPAPEVMQPPRDSSSRCRADATRRARPSDASAVCSMHVSPARAIRSGYNSDIEPGTRKPKLVRKIPRGVNRYVQRRRSQSPPPGFRRISGASRSTRGVRRGQIVIEEHDLPIAVPHQKGPQSVKLIPGIIPFNNPFTGIFKRKEYIMKLTITPWRSLGIISNSS